MTTLKREENGVDFAVRVRGNGFFYAIRRIVDDAIERHRRRRMIEQTEAELARLPDYVRQDIAWPATRKHEEH